MKFRLYLTAGATAIMWSLFFIMSWDPQQVVAMLLLSPLCALSIPFVLVWDIVGVITLWSRYRLYSFAPLTVLVMACLFTGTVGQVGMHLRLERFRKQLPAYERVAKAVLRNDKREMEDLGLTVGKGYDPTTIPILVPERLKKLAWQIKVITDPKDEAGTVVFVCVGGVIHDCYLYRADGDMSRAVHGGRFHLHAQITTNWCAAAY